MPLLVLLGSSIFLRSVEISAQDCSASTPPREFSGVLGKLQLSIRTRTGPVQVELARRWGGVRMPLSFLLECSYVVGANCSPPFRQEPLSAGLGPSLFLLRSRSKIEKELPNGKLH